MIVQVCVIVYNRFHNVKHWLECWDKCDKKNAEVNIIHNFDMPRPEYIQLCEKHGARYIHRHNVGYDIGALQDVCNGRLKGFPAWERILWMTDDTFPMSKTFVKQFNDAMLHGVGVAAMEISPYVTTHTRTTGFMIDRSTAEKLKFSADPITTKQQCYLFEHRNGEQIFFNQIKNLGLSTVMVSPKHVSPLWDTGYHRRVDRNQEHEKIFQPRIMPDKVVIICPIFKTYPQIISSLLLQTHTNWNLQLIHDGPDTENIRRFIPDDKRIEFLETPKHGGSWGHYIRQVGIEEFSGQGDFVVITNPDNYHVPVFLEYMLKGFSPHLVAVYCSEMVHSYKAWQTIPCKLAKGYVDCAGIMVRSWAAQQVGWNDISTHSADWVYFSDLLNTFGEGRFKKVRGCLLIHN